MSQPNVHNPKPHQAMKPSSTNPTKLTILEWLTSIIKDHPHKLTIQQLGDGEIYCRIINHYIPGTISANRIVASPKNQYEYMLNLKQFQNALSKLKLSIFFDIQKISKLKFNENWALVSLLYKALENSQCRKSEPQGRKEQLEQSSGSHKQVPLETSSKINHQEHAPLHKDVKPVLPIPYFPFSQDFARGSLLFTVDRVKEILLTNTHDTEKIRLIRLVFGLDKDVKIEEDESTLLNTIRYL